MRSIPDVAILGAGMAGLAAGRILAEHGLSVEIVEARERVGGRVHTIHPEAPLPAELGPEYVHGSPDVTVALLREAGATREPVRDVHHGRRGDALVEEPQVWSRFGRFLAHAPPRSRDESAQEYLARRRLSDHDRFLFSTLIEGYYGAPLSEISIASIAADGGGATGDEASAMTRPRHGYGPLAHFLLDRIKHAGGRIRYGHVVRAIDWSTQHVRVDYQYGNVAASLVARRVIVTLPLAVLVATGDDAIAFHPQLGDHALAMRELGTGNVIKLVVCMTAPVWNEYAHVPLDFVHAPPGAAFPTFWVRSRDTAHQLTAWAGGAQTHIFEELIVDEILDDALGDFAATVGMPLGRLATAVDHYHLHDFGADPFARGAYSFTRVGGHTAAERLAKPLGDVLYFAGEATDAEYEGSVAGALRSGERAAAQILERYGMRHAA